jgi:hypothetical protein
MRLKALDFGRSFQALITVAGHRQQHWVIFQELRSVTLQQKPKFTFNDSHILFEKCMKSAIWKTF